jgi:hypothetical protein
MYPRVPLSAALLLSANRWTAADWLCTGRRFASSLGGAEQRRGEDGFNPGRDTVIVRVSWLFQKSDHVGFCIATDQTP